MFCPHLQEGEKDIGCNDGTFRGKRYFTCEDGFGMFVPLNRLSAHYDTKLTRQGSYSNQEEPREHSTYPAVAGDRGNTPGSNILKEESSVDCQSIFRIKDRVCFYDKWGKKMTGTVKWIGNASRYRKFDYTVVGIQTVS